MSCFNNNNNCNRHNCGCHNDCCRNHCHNDWNNGCNNNCNNGCRCRNPFINCPCGTFVDTDNNSDNF